MSGSSPSQPALGVAVVMAAMAAGSWYWQASVFRSQRAEVPPEAWQQVREDYPLASGAQESPPRSSKVAEDVIHANPFSPKRHQQPPKPETDSAVQPAQPPPPKFVYKGHINVGLHQRAIVEDTANHKTYFLEVGQEVTGFKVLDITENRVVLSNLQTKEEIVVSLTALTTP